MSPLRAFFMPFTLFLGACIVFVIFNPVILFGIIVQFVSLIFSNWLVGAMVVLTVLYLAFKEDDKTQ